MARKTNLKSPPQEEDNNYSLQFKNEGKPRRVAKIAALNKFLRIYYARVKEVYATA